MMSCGLRSDYKKAGFNGRKVEKTCFKRLDRGETSAIERRFKRVGRFGDSSVLNADVAELVDALDLGSSAARRESSSLSIRTT